MSEIKLTRFEFTKYDSANMQANLLHLAYPQGEQTIFVSYNYFFKGEDKADSLLYLQQNQFVDAKGPHDGYIATLQDIATEKEMIFHVTEEKYKTKIDEFYNSHRDKYQGDVFVVPLKQDSYIIR